MHNWNRIQKKTSQRTEAGGWLIKLQAIISGFIIESKKAQGIQRQNKAPELARVHKMLFVDMHAKDLKIDSLINRYIAALKLLGKRTSMFDLVGSIQALEEPGL